MYKCFLSRVGNLVFIDGVMGHDMFQNTLKE